MEFQRAHQWVRVDMPIVFRVFCGFNVSPLDSLAGHLCSWPRMVATLGFGAKAFVEHSGAVRVSEVVACWRHAAVFSWSLESFI